MNRRAAPPAGDQVLATNRQARFRYTLLQRFEAGIALHGAEVKSLRAGKAQLRDSYCRVRNGEVFLHQCHISPYAHQRVEEQDPLRVRKLLLHRREIRRLERDSERAGRTLIPLRLYLKDGRVKVEIALAQGKKLFDKREAKRKQEQDREVRRALKQRSRPGR